MTGWAKQKNKEKATGLVSMTMFHISGIPWTEMWSKMWLWSPCQFNAYWPFFFQKPRSQHARIDMRRVKPWQMKSLSCVFLSIALSLVESPLCAFNAPGWLSVYAYVSSSSSRFADDTSYKHYTSKSGRTCPRPLVLLHCLRALSSWVHLFFNLRRTLFYSKTSIFQAIDYLE